MFGNSNSNDNGNKIDTSLFVQKPYLRTIYLESNIEEDIDLKINTELKIYQIQLVLEKKLQSYVDNLFNDPSVLKNTAHIDINDRKITNARFIQVINASNWFSFNSKTLCW